MPITLPEITVEGSPEPALCVDSVKGIVGVTKSSEQKRKEKTWERR